MKKELFTIESNELVAKGTFRMVLRSGTFRKMRCGQFVDIALDGRFLRRPISVCDSSDGVLTLLYKTVGDGTFQMSDMHAGEVLDILTGLGNGFDVSACSESALLLGGGIGTAPLYQLARELVADGRKVHVVCGFNTADEMVLYKELKAVGADVAVATLDGSCGVRGFVTDAYAAAPQAYDYYYVCGPMPMEKAVWRQFSGKGEFSLEERMGCGTGICYGCSVMTASGSKRVCKDGPVFRKEELLWQETD